MVRKLLGALLLIGAAAFAQPGWAQSVTPRVPPNGPPTSIAAGATWTSGLMYVDGHAKVAAGVTLSQGGTMTLQRFLDPAGLVAAGSISITLTAGQPNYLSVVDGNPFDSFTVTIANGSSGAAANASNFGLLLAD